jgi:hypothetical protein
MSVSEFHLKFSSVFRSPIIISLSLSVFPSVSSILSHFFLRSLSPFFFFLCSFFRHPVVPKFFPSIRYLSLVRLHVGLSLVTPGGLSGGQICENPIVFWRSFFSLICLFLNAVCISSPHRKQYPCNCKRPPVLVVVNILAQP